MSSSPEICMRLKSTIFALEQETHRIDHESKSELLAVRRVFEIQTLNAERADANPLSLARKRNAPTRSPALL